MFWSTSARVASCVWVKNSGPIVMHEPYKNNDISCKNPFGVKKVHPGKIEPYLEVNAWTDWQLQDLISVLPRGLAHWTHWYYTGHIIASYCFQGLIRLPNLFSAIFCYNFKRLTREHKSHNYLSFSRLFISDHI